MRVVPVIMDGEQEFYSQAEAARWLLESWGIKPDKRTVPNIQQNINKCVNGRVHKAYGHTWEAIR